jgi:hypothetical protein
VASNGPAALPASAVQATPPAPAAARKAPPPVPTAPPTSQTEAPEEREARKPKKFAPVMFTAAVSKDSAKEFKGQCKAEMTSEGLWLRKGKKELLLPVGANAEHCRGNRLAVELVDGRRVELGVVRFGSYVNRLSEDVVDYLNGERRGPRSSGYKLEWYLYLPAVLPLGIPILTLGGVLPMMLGFGMAGACMGIAQQHRWPIGTRLALEIGLAILAYIVLVIIAVAFGVVILASGGKIQ